MNELQRVTGLFAVATSSCHSMVILCWGYIFLSLDSYPLLWLHFPVTRQLPFLLWLYFPVIRQLPPPPLRFFLCVCAVATFSCHLTVTLFCCGYIFLSPDSYSFCCGYIFLSPGSPPPPLCCCCCGYIFLSPDSYPFLLLLWLHFPVTRQFPFVAAKPGFDHYRNAVLSSRPKFGRSLSSDAVSACQSVSHVEPLSPPPPPPHTHTPHIHTTSASRTHMWRSKRTPVAQQRAYS